MQNSPGVGRSGISGQQFKTLFLYEKCLCVCVCVCVCVCADFKDSGVSVVTPIFTDSLPEFKGLIITHLTLEHTLRQLVGVVAIIRSPS